MRYSGWKPFTRTFRFRLTSDPCSPLSYHIAGSKYIGTWVNGKCEGAGEFVHANHRFQGNWTDGNVRDAFKLLNTRLNAMATVCLSCFLDARPWKVHFWHWMWTAWRVHLRRTGAHCAVFNTCCVVFVLFVFSVNSADRRFSCYGIMLRLSGSRRRRRGGSNYRNYSQMEGRKDYGNYSLYHRAGSTRYGINNKVRYEYDSKNFKQDSKGKNLFSKEKWTCCRLLNMFCVLVTIEHNGFKMQKSYERQKEHCVCKNQ